MANQGHLKILKQGVSEWNSWRRSKSFDLDLSSADLNGADLRGANLYGVKLNGADLSRANLQRANFYNAELARTDLTEADLSQADFNRAFLGGAKLCGADLTRAKFLNANLSRADLTGANFAEADFAGANMKEAGLVGANLTGVTLNHAHLERAHLSGAVLTKALLIGAVLSGADLGGADLRGTDLNATVGLGHATLSKADLSGIVLIKANLRGATLGMANLEGAKLSGCTFHKAYLRSVNLRGVDLTRADFSEAFLFEADLRDADLTGADLRGATCERTDFSNANLAEACLIGTNLNGATLNGTRLWETQRAGWSIKGVVCESVYLEGEKVATFAPGDFERLYSDKTKIVLFYKGGLSPLEFSALPALVKHLEESSHGCTLRLESITDASGGAVVTLGVEDAEDSSPESHKRLKAELEAAATQVIEYQRKALAEWETRLRLEGEVKQLGAVVDKLILRPSLSFHSQGGVKMGDEYNVGQAGAAGPHAHAHDMTLQQIGGNIVKSMDLSALAAELATLREAMSREAKETGHYIAVGKVAEAEEAAKAKDSLKVAQSLKAAGKWALDGATKIGTSLAAEALKESLGMK